MLAENNFLPYSVAQDTTVPQFYYQLGQMLGTYRVWTTQPRELKLTIRLNEGINELSFYCNETFVPSQLASNTTDSRSLSVYLKNVQIG